jgi:competence protein ComEC
LLAISAIALGVYIGSRQAVPAAGLLKVHFLNVPQGDCILVQTPDDRNVLFDSGGEESADYVIRYLQSFGVHRIDLVLISHPSDDTIGAMSSVLKEFGVSRIIDTGVPRHSRRYDELLSDIRSRRIDYRLGGASSYLPVSGRVSFQVICTVPDHRDSSSSDDSRAMVVRVVDKGVSFLLMGDANARAEGHILAARQDLESCVLEVARHEEEFGTSNELIEAVKPDYVVMPCGDDSIRESPFAAVIRRLDSARAKIFCMDSCGSIIFTTDGRHLRVTRER